MKAIHVQLTEKERITMQAMIRMEIHFNEQCERVGIERCERMGIKPANDTETLKALYQKLAGHKY